MEKQFETGGAVECHRRLQSGDGDCLRVGLALGIPVYYLHETYKVAITLPSAGCHSEMDENSFPPNSCRNPPRLFISDSPSQAEDSKFKSRIVLARVTGMSPAVLTVNRLGTGEPSGTDSPADHS